MYIYLKKLQRLRGMFMKIQSVAVLGAGAVGSYVIWGLSEKIINEFLYGHNLNILSTSSNKEA